MGSKKVLFLGIVLLIIGIIVRKLTAFEMAGLMLILVGVLCKTLYIIAKVKSGEYRPGKELAYLVLGLCLFLLGIYLRKSDQSLEYPVYMIAIGIVLKVIFIISFIKIVKSNKVDNPVISK